MNEDEAFEELMNQLYGDEQDALDELQDELIDEEIKKNDPEYWRYLNGKLY